MNINFLTIIILPGTTRNHYWVELVSTVKYSWLKSFVHNEEMAFCERQYFYKNKITITFIKRRVIRQQ